MRGNQTQARGMAAGASYGEDHQEEAAQKGILSVPTVIAEIDGTEVARESGYFSLDKMLARLERYMKMAGETEL